MQLQTESSTLEASGTEKESPPRTFMEKWNRERARENESGRPRRAGAGKAREPASHRPPMGARARGPLPAAPQTCGPTRAAGRECSGVRAAGIPPDLASCRVLLGPSRGVPATASPRPPPPSLRPALPTARLAGDLRAAAGAQAPSPPAWRPLRLCALGGVRPRWKEERAGWGGRGLSSPGAQRFGEKPSACSL